MTGGEVLVASLREGVEVVFGLPGVCATTRALPTLCAASVCPQ
jgi:thiamine pyrophosphate-dependent acetolactate synthase large subunit-like protein